MQGKKPSYLTYLHWLEKAELGSLTEGDHLGNKGGNCFTKYSGKYRFSRIWQVTGLAQSNLAARGRRMFAVIIC